MDERGRKIKLLQVNIYLAKGMEEEIALCGRFSPSLVLNVDIVAGEKSYRVRPLHFLDMVHGRRGS